MLKKCYDNWSRFEDGEEEGCDRRQDRVLDLLTSIKLSPACMAGVGGEEVMWWAELCANCERGCDSQPGLSQEDSGSIPPQTPPVVDGSLVSFGTEQNGTVNVHLPRSLQNDVDPKESLTSLSTF